MNCYETIDSAARAVIRRHPTWIDTYLPDDPQPSREPPPTPFCTPSPAPSATDSPCPNASDAARATPDRDRANRRLTRSLLLLAATARRTRSKIGANATVDYHADVLGYARRWPFPRRAARPEPASPAERSPGPQHRHRETDSATGTVDATSNSPSTPPGPS